MKDPLIEETSMAGLSDLEQARTSIGNVLARIKFVPELAWHFVATESWAKLTEAYATLTGESVVSIRTAFMPEKTTRPDAPAIERNFDEIFPLVSQNFIARMSEELQDNQSKGDWKAWQPDRLDCVDELYHHVKKLHRSLSQNDTDRVAEHSADLANIAMKTHERHGRS